MRSMIGCPNKGRTGEVIPERRGTMERYETNVGVDGKGEGGIIGSQYHDPLISCRSVIGKREFCGVITIEAIVPRSHTVCSSQRSSVEIMKSARDQSWLGQR